MPPQSGQALCNGLGIVRIVTRSGVGRTCATKRSAGISGRIRRDTVGSQTSGDDHRIWRPVTVCAIQLHQNSG